MMLELKYFVLNPGKNNEYGEASCKALEAYAKAIHSYDPELAKDLRHWATSYKQKIQEAKTDEKR